MQVILPNANGVPLPLDLKSPPITSPQKERDPAPTYLPSPYEIEAHTVFAVTIRGDKAVPPPDDAHVASPPLFFFSM